WVVSDRLVRAQSSVDQTMVASAARMIRKIFPRDARRKGSIRVAHDRIVRTADAEPHEVKKITADHIPRRMETAAIGELDHRRVRIGGKTFRYRWSETARWARWVGRWGPWVRRRPAAVARGRGQR